MAIEVFVNGKRREVEGPTSIAALFGDLRIRPEVATVALNKTFLKRDQLEETVAQEGDTVEIMIQLAGGSHD